MAIYSGLLEVAVVLPFLLLGGGLLALAWGREGWRGSGLFGAPGEERHHGRVTTVLGLVGTWLVLTALTLWCEFLVLFVALHALLFGLGNGAASIGLIVGALILEATPIAWAIVILRRTRHAELPAAPKG